jgi:hypothetical protein
MFRKDMISICHSINVQQESSLNYQVFLQFKNVCLRFSLYLILGNKCQFALIVPILLGSMSAHQKITMGVDLTVYLHPLWVFFNLTSSFQHPFSAHCFRSIYLYSPLLKL